MYYSIYIADMNVTLLVEESTTNTSHFDEYLLAIDSLLREYGQVPRFLIFLWSLYR